MLLAVEVVSPSRVRTDRGTKREFFQRVGVPEYWVVDLDARVVERWHPTGTAPDFLSGFLEWNPDGATKPLSLDLAAFFATVIGA